MSEQTVPPLDAEIVADTPSGEGASPVAEPREPDPLPVGECLRVAREAAGMSIESIAQRFKLGVSQVAALEASEWDKLPGRTFVRGMVRSYARVLELDSEALLVRVMSEAQAVDQTEVIPASTPPAPALACDTPAKQGVNRRDILIGVFGVLVLLLAALVYFVAPDASVAITPSPLNSTANEPAPVVPSTTPSENTNSSPASSPEPAASNDKTSTDQGQEAARSGNGLILTFTGPSWVEVKDANGEIIFSQTGLPGTEQRIQGKAPLSLHIGNASGVQVKYKGKLVDLQPYTSSNISRVKLD